MNLLGALQPDGLTYFYYFAPPNRPLSAEERPRWPDFACATNPRDRRAELLALHEVARNAAFSPIRLHAALLSKRLARERSSWRRAHAALAHGRARAGDRDAARARRPGERPRPSLVAVPVAASRNVADETGGPPDTVLSYVDCVFDQALRAQDMKNGERAVTFAEELYRMVPGPQSAQTLAEAYRLANRREQLARVRRLASARDEEVAGFGVVLALVARDMGDEERHAANLAAVLRVPPRARVPAARGPSALRVARNLPRCPALGRNRACSRRRSVEPAPVEAPGGSGRAARLPASPATGPPAAPVPGRPLRAALLVTALVLVLTADERYFGLVPDGRIMVRTAVSMVTLGEIGIARGQAVGVDRPGGDGVSRYGIGPSLTLTVPTLLRRALRARDQAGHVPDALHPPPDPSPPRGGGRRRRARPRLGRRRTGGLPRGARDGRRLAALGLRGADFSEPLQAALCRRDLRRGASAVAPGIPLRRSLVLVGGGRRGRRVCALLSKSVFILALPAALALVVVGGPRAGRLRRGGAALLGWLPLAALWLGVRGRPVRAPLRVVRRGALQPSAARRPLAPDDRAEQGALSLLSARRSLARRLSDPLPEEPDRRRCPSRASRARFSFRPPRGGPGTERSAGDRGSCCRSFRSSRCSRPSAPGASPPLVFRLLFGLSVAVNLIGVLQPDVDTMKYLLDPATPGPLPRGCRALPVLHLRPRSRDGRRAPRQPVLGRRGPRPLAAPRRAVAPPPAPPGGRRPRPAPDAAVVHGSARAARGEPARDGPLRRRARAPDPAVRVAASGDVALPEESRRLLGSGLHGGDPRPGAPGAGHAARSTAPSTSPSGSGRSCRIRRRPSSSRRATASPGGARRFAELAARVRARRTVDRRFPVVLALSARDDRRFRRGPRAGRDVARDRGEARRSGSSSTIPPAEWPATLRDVTGENRTPRASAGVDSGSSWRPRASPSVLVIAAATSTRPVLDALRPDLEKAAGGPRRDPIRRDGNARGLPPEDAGAVDLFLALGEDGPAARRGRPRRGGDRHALRDGEPRRRRGSRVLVRPAAPARRRDGPRLREAPDPRLAVVAPKVAPEGASIEEVLAAALILNELKEKLVPVPSSDEAIARVLSGDAEAAIIPSSLAARSAAPSCPVDPTLHAPLRLTAAIVSASSRKQAAAARPRRPLGAGDPRDLAPVRIHGSVTEGLDPRPCPLRPDPGRLTGDRRDPRRGSRRGGGRRSPRRRSRPCLSAGVGGPRRRGAGRGAEEMARRDPRRRRRSSGRSSPRAESRGRRPKGSSFSTSAS